MTEYPDIPGNDLYSQKQVSDAVIRNFCGWHVAPVIEETLTLDGSGAQRLALPSLRVEEVSRLVISGEEIKTFSWSDNGWLTLPGGQHFPGEDRCVEVTLRHGFGYAPELAQVRQGLQTRAAMAPTGNIVNQRAGSQSVTYATSNGEVRGGSLLQQEQELLAKYKLNWGW